MVLHNTGNTAESFALSADLGSFPAGTNFQFLNGVLALASNQTPVVGVDDGIVITVIADLPSGYSGTVDLDAQITATSVAESSVSDAVTLRIVGGVAAASLDLTLFDGVNDIGGVGPDVNIVGPITVVPGSTETLIMRVQNLRTAGASDEYALSWQDVAGNGLTAQFFENGQTILATQPVAPGSHSGEFTAEVTLPSTLTPGVYELRFAAENAALGVSDSMTVSFNVETVVDLAIDGGGVRQVSQNGSVDIPITVRNNGNTVVNYGDITLAIAQTGSDQTFSNVLFFDTDGDGNYDSTNEPVASNYLTGNTDTLAPNDELRFVLRTVASSSTSAVTEITVTVEHAQDSDPLLTLLDIVAGNDVCVLVRVDIPSHDQRSEYTMTLNLEYSYVNTAIVEMLDENGLVTIGNSVMDLVKSTDKSQALPGEVITYTIVFTNRSEGVLSNAVVTDSVPEFTSYVGGSARCLSVPSNTNCLVSQEPADGGDGILEWTTSGSIFPTAQGTLEYQVRVDN